MSGPDTATKAEATADVPERSLARPATTRRRWWLPWWTGSAGFVLDVLFWHLVGFWSFVSEVAFNGDDPKSPSRLIDLEAARSVRASAEAVDAARPAAKSAAATVEVADAEPADGNTSDSLSDLLQCSEARRPSGDGDTDVLACPPLRRRLPFTRQTATRADRQMDAREAAERLARGWETGVSRIETGSIR